jgi:hypothetical protein
MESGDGEEKKKEVSLQGLFVREYPVTGSGAGLEDARAGVGAGNGWLFRTCRAVFMQ